jgi:hypothetical protein
MMSLVAGAGVAPGGSMTPYDRGIRDLLPLFKPDPEALGMTAVKDPVGPVLGTALPEVHVADGRSIGDSPQGQDQPSHGPSGTPILPQNVPTSSGLPAGAIPSHGDGSAIAAPVQPVEPVVFAPSFHRDPILSGGRGGSDGPDLFRPNEAGEVGAEPKGAESRSPHADSGNVPGAPQGTWPGQGDVAADPASDPVEETDGEHDTGGDGEHDIAVTQLADVEQDATIVIQGYMGSVVSRFHIDQKILMDQDADIEVDIAGNGHFAITIDQKMYISQQTDVDVSIFDEDGVLYVDLFLRDVIEVDQDTSILFTLYDGFGDNDLVVIQDLEMDQEADVQVEIEDDLEERYSVAVDVAVLQDVDADEEANLRIANHAGDLEIDLEANQVANIDQETFVKLDFALL